MRASESLAAVIEHQAPDTSDGEARAARLREAQEKEEVVRRISGRPARMFVDPEPFMDEIVIAEARVMPFMSLKGLNAQRERREKHEKG